MKLSLVVLSFLGSLAVCHADAVRLTINGPDGKPVAGAKVRVVESKGAWYRREYLPARDLVSDAQGVVSLESQAPLFSEADKNKSLEDQAKMAVMQARIIAPGLAVAGTNLKPGGNTVSLVAGKPLEGVALDEDQKPVEGARLLFTTVANTTDTDTKKEQFFRLPEPLALEANTDAQGKWKFDSLPATGTLTIQVDDRRFKRDSFPLDVALKTPPLFLSRGAIIKGRLLKPDGTGLAGIKIYAGDFDHQPVTDANGRFEATGVDETSVNLQIVGGGREQKLPFIIGYKLVEAIKPGEVRDVGDWKTTKGVRLKGVIVNKVTKKPVTKASVSMWGRGGNSNAESDKTGAFELLASPDQSGLSVSADGFASFSKMSIPEAKDGVIDVGTLELVPGAKAEGVVVDEDGNPVPDARLYASVRNGDRQYARSYYTDGKFSIDGLQDGAYTLTATGYEIVSGAKFTVAGGKVAPLPVKVVLKGKVGNAGPQTPAVITGRVVDGEGQPVAGAKLTIRVQSSDNSYSSPAVVSQSDGSFKTSSYGQGTSLRIVGFSRPGFSRGQEKIEQKDGHWNVDLTVQKRGEALRGRVVDAGGKPVVGAFVGLQTGFELPVATDANGAFALVDAPQTGVTLLASNGPSLATFTPQKAGEPIEIVLPAAEPVEDKAALADEILEKGRLGYKWNDLWDALGWKRIEAAFMRSPSKNTGAWSWTWKSYLEALARHEPQVLLEREAELRAQTPADALPDFEALLMATRAGSQDEAQREQARTWLAAQEKEKRDISGATVSRLLQLASVGSRLDKKTGDMWLDYAVQVAGQIDSKPAMEYSWSWGPVAARVSPEAPSLLVQDWDTTAQLQLLVAAMGTWTDDKNVEAGRQGWEKIQELGLDAAQHPDQKVHVVEGFMVKPSDLVNQGRGKYAELLAYSDPKAALALIGTMDEFQKVQTLQTIAQQAVKQKKYDVAKEAVSAIADVPIGNVEFVAYAAGLAQQFDETLAAPLWEKAYLKVRPRDEEIRGGYSPSISAYAQERAVKWPGESRILIEREWAKRIAQAEKPNTDDYDDNGRSMQSLAQAMARVNPRRALEMTEKITEKQDLRAETRGGIAVVLLTK